MSVNSLIKSRSFVVLFILAVSALFTSCNLTVEPLNNDQLQWFKPYLKSDSIIFKSEKGERDTIIFHKTKIEKDTTKNFIELGYYSTNYFSVPYEFTKGSYHQSATMSDGQHRYDHNLFNLLVSSNKFTQFEIEFIGTIFNGEHLNNIVKLSPTTYYFDSTKANYQGMNSEKSINDFTFDTELGIIKFTDDRGIKWSRWEQR